MRLALIVLLALAAGVGLFVAAGSADLPSLALKSRLSERVWFLDSIQRSGVATAVLADDYVSMCQLQFGDDEIWIGGGCASATARGYSIEGDQLIAPGGFELGKGYTDLLCIAPKISQLCVYEVGSDMRFEIVRDYLKIYFDEGRQFMLFKQGHLNERSPMFSMDNLIRTVLSGLGCDECRR